MSGDVVDLLGRHICIGEGGGHCPCCACAVVRRSDQIGGVRGHAIAEDLNIRSGATRACMFELLDDQHAGALGRSETVAVTVERTRSPGRIVIVARSQRAHRGEARQSDLADAGLGAACAHHIGGAAANHLHGIADGLGSGGAGGRDGVRVAECAQLDRDVRGRHVRQHLREE